MTKKILAIVMIAGVLGAMIGGCSKGSDDTTSPAGTASTAGK